jgi:hypothetical protein
MHFSLKVNALDSCTYSCTIESWLSKKMLLLAIVNVLQNVVAVISGNNLKLKYRFCLC